MFGTKICDLHVPVRPGGDIAFLNAVLKVLIERTPWTTRSSPPTPRAGTKLVADLDGQSHGRPAGRSPA